MDLAARLAAIPLDATVRLSYLPRSRRPDGMHHHVDVRWRGVDPAANVVRFACSMGDHGLRWYAAPIGDVEETWCPEGTWHVRVSGYLDAVPLAPYRYVSSGSPKAPLAAVHGGGVFIKAGDGNEAKGGDVVIIGDVRGGDLHAANTPSIGNVLAAKKSDAIDRLSKVADQLTGLILRVHPNRRTRRLGFPLVSPPAVLFEYPRLVHETQLYLSHEFIGELREFEACAQRAYNELMALRQGETPANILAVHGRVETARARLMEASRTELYRQIPVGVTAVPRSPSAADEEGYPRPPKPIPPTLLDPWYLCDEGSECFHVANGACPTATPSARSALQALRHDKLDTAADLARAIRGAHAAWIPWCDEFMAQVEVRRRTIPAP